MTGRRIVLLDACVLINLGASGVGLDEFSEALDCRFVVTETVGEEALFLRCVDQEHGEILEPLNIAKMVSSGALEVVEMSTEEIDAFVRFAAEVDDGEASSLSVAQSRGHPIATDDRKARRMAGSFDPPLELLGTTDIVKKWADGNHQNSARLSHVIEQIEQRANFIPPRSNTLCPWWFDNKLIP
jgi:predicted nucleic acid-binding protein